MPGPFVDDAQVAQARGIASQVIEPVFALLRRHPTISVQRTVLRLFGMSDAGPGGVPLTNLMTDRLKAAGVLNRGAAYWYGRALQLGAASPLDAVERIAALPAGRLGPLSAETEGNLRAEVRREAEAAVDELRPVAPRLRPPRRHHRGLRRDLRHAGELPDHAGGARRREPQAQALHPAH